MTSMHERFAGKIIQAAQTYRQHLVAVTGAVAILLSGAGLLRTWFAASAGPNSAGAAESRAGDFAASYEQGLLPFLRQYCRDCHGDGARKGEFAFDRYQDVDALKRDRAVWTKVLKLLKVGVMPPVDADQPSAEERARAVKWLDHQLFYVDCSQPQDPGRVTVRRLNKSEYNHTIRDLLGIDFRPAQDFPADDTGHGFDNLGDVLTVPPLLLEKYLDAAEDIAERAVRVHSPLYARTRYAAKPKGNVRDLIEGKVLIVKGPTTQQAFAFPRTGSYVIRVQAKVEPAGEEPGKIEVRLGTRTVHTFAVKDAGQVDVFETAVQAEQGTQNVAATLLNNGTDKSLHVGYIEVEGPLEFTDQERRAQPLVRVVPRGSENPGQAARANLQPFLPRAFRRPVAAEECERYVALAQRALARGDSFDQAMNLTLQAVLVSPHFLFRVEGGRRREAGIEMLDDFALASRLSYFLWSSMPDDELLRLAGQNRLHEPDVLRAQALRLLDDPRADALVANFAGQWLGLRRLTTKDVQPDAAQFPDFTDQLRLDLWKETELFFGSIVRSNSSIYELLNGQYTFLNERLARHYGIDGVSGPEFRRVNFTEARRAGVLTQGSILTLTSHPSRTSPVKRGEWVLTNLLGDAPPEPPPSVPTLEQTRAAHPALTLRQQMERHRRDPGCASCHQVMDAIGFGLENFDPVGRWRDQDGRQPIDSRGALPTGEVFDGPVELIAVLKRRKTEFGRCLTEKMLTYALGRGVEWYDKCAVDEILAQLARDDRFATLILGIVQSAPFQLRRVQGPQP
jgi:mono/diheme cytochrome c family protein